MAEPGCWQAERDFSDLLSSIWVGGMWEGVPSLRSRSERYEILPSSGCLLKEKETVRAVWPGSSLLEVLIVLNSMFWKTSRRPSLCIKFLVTEL